MANKWTNALAEDEARLKKKVAERRAHLSNPNGDPGFRRLHKRLKRLQRLRRKLALRQQHAKGKAKSDVAEKPAAPAA